MMKRRPVLAALIVPLLVFGGPAFAADKTLTVGAAVFRIAAIGQFLCLPELDDADNDPLVARDNKGGSTRSGREPGQAGRPDQPALAAAQGVSSATA